LLASRGAAPATEVSELKVTIREWDVPTKARIPMIRPLGRTARCGSRNRWLTSWGGLIPLPALSRVSAHRGKNSGRTGLLRTKTEHLVHGEFRRYIGKLDRARESDGIQDAWMTVWMILTLLSRCPWGPSGSRRKAGTQWAARPAHGKDGIKEGANRKRAALWIQINSKGVPFFCELGTNKMGKIDPRPWGSPSTNCQRELGRAAWAITADDKIYFTDFKGGNLGRLDPTTAP